MLILPGGKPAQERRGSPLAVDSLYTTCMYFLSPNSRIHILKINPRKAMATHITYMDSKIRHEMTLSMKQKQTGMARKETVAKGRWS